MLDLGLRIYIRIGSQEGAYKSSLYCVCFKEQPGKSNLDEIMALNCTQYGKKKTMQTFYFAKYVYVNILKREREADVKSSWKMENFMICLASSPSLPSHNM